MKFHFWQPIKIILVIFLLAGCDPVRRHKTLSFFFDGVPEPASMTKEQAKSKSDEEKKSTLKQPVNFEIVTPEGPIITHYPFGKHKCDLCHVDQFSQKLKAEESDLCFKCHDNFLVDAPEKHFPAEYGMCLECHVPHDSKNPKLLREPKDKICLKCHDISSEDSEVKHPPAAAGLCLACHNPHVSKNPHLLKIAGQTLCTRCHNKEKLAAAVPVHEDIGEEECITCHTEHEEGVKLIK